MASNNQGELDKMLGHSQGDMMFGDSKHKAASRSSQPKEIRALENLGNDDDIGFEEPYEPEPAVSPDTFLKKRAHKREHRELQKTLHALDVPSLTAAEVEEDPEDDDDEGEFLELEDDDVSRSNPLRQDQELS